MAKTYTREEFVETYGPYIARATRGTGLSPGTVISQAIIESQGKVNGSYRVGGSTLSREANNFFGIKCHGWSGRGYNIDTREETATGESYMERGACFRAYDSVEDSIDDYIRFLQQNSNYRRAGVFEADTVYQQAVALKRAGYATDVNYANTISKVYEGVKGYVDKFSRYGIRGVWQSFRNNPKSFLKRNRMAFVGLGIVIVSVGLGAYAIENYNKKRK